MVREVAERLHRLPVPTLIVGDPSIVAGELRKVPNQRLDQILPPPNRMNVASSDEDGFVVLAKIVPLLGVADRPIRHVEIATEKIRLQSGVLGFEAFAHRLLAVAIPAKVRPRICQSKGSFADDVVGMELDAVGREVGPGRRRRRHILLFEKRGKKTTRIKIHQLCSKRVSMTYRKMQESTSMPDIDNDDLPRGVPASLSDSPVGRARQNLEPA